MSAHLLVERSELKPIKDNLIMQPNPQNYTVAGEEGVGKTTVLNYIYDVGQSPSSSHHQSLYVPVRADTLAETNSLSFWWLALQSFKEAIGDKTSVKSLHQYRRTDLEIEMLFSELDQAIKDALPKYQRIIFLIDDFDLFAPSISSPGISHRDLSKMRSLISNYGTEKWPRKSGEPGFSFVLFTADRLASIVDSVRRRTPPGVHVTPLERFFTEVRLGLLSGGDANNFINKWGQAKGISFLDEDFKFLLDEAGKYPYLLDIACEHLYLGRYGQGQKVPHVDISTDIRYDARVIWLSKTLAARRTEQEWGVLRQLASGGDGGDPGTLRELALLGLVKKDDKGKTVLFGKAFRYWVEMWPTQPNKPTESFSGQSISAPASTTFVYLPDQGKVWLGDEEKLLTPLENKLMKYLHKNAGRICSKEQLLKEVFRPGASLDSVQKGVERLRSKIELDPSSPQRLISFYGHGYILKLD